MNKKQQAGQRGGLATFARHGRAHMQHIGAKGAMVTWTRYVLVPVGQTEYAMMNRETKKIISVRAR